MEQMEALKQSIREKGKMVVAFSGGVDSTFLLKVAHDVLGDGAVAVTARSCSFPERELREAKAFCEKEHIKHIVVESEELHIEGFSHNPTNRCYLCKKELFTKIWDIAKEYDIPYVAEASNLDDNGDYRPGLMAVAELSVLSPLREAGMKNRRLTSSTISYVLAPRINAAGRMEVDSDDENAAPSGGHSAVYLMVARDEEVASEYGAFIDTCNQDRKNIDRSITQEAHEIIESRPELKNRKSTVIYNPKWMKGIVGIVASRLIETYYRPTVVLTMSNGYVTGSARSVPGFDLYQAVESCADLLENFGGHIYAAGLTMRPENVEEFTRRFNDYVEEHIDPEMLIPQVEIDSELLFSDITHKFRTTLNRFQPFGPENNAPVFVTRGVSNRGDSWLVGAEQEHLKMDLIQGQKPNTSIPAIAFQQPTHYEHVRSGKCIDVCYSVVENHYRGTVSAQLRIKDIKKTPVK